MHFAFFSPPCILIYFRKEKSVFLLFSLYAYGCHSKRRGNECKADGRTASALIGSRGGLGSVGSSGRYLAGEVRKRERLLVYNGSRAVGSLYGYAVPPRR